MNDLIFWLCMTFLAAFVSWWSGYAFGHSVGRLRGMEDAAAEKRAENLRAFWRTKRYQEN